MSEEKTSCVPSYPGLLLQGAPDPKSCELQTLGLGQAFWPWGQDDDLVGALATSSKCWAWNYVFPQATYHNSSPFSLGGSEKGVSCRGRTLAEVGAGCLCSASRKSLLCSEWHCQWECSFSGSPEFRRDTPGLEDLGRAFCFIFLLSLSR